MHRIEGADFVVESGNRRFIDQNLPGISGTIFAAEWGNAVQEELSNLIVHAGLVVETSSGLDRMNGWTQLRDAIFLSGALDTSAIGSLDLSKMFGSINIISIGSTTKKWSEGFEDAIRSRSDGTVVDQTLTNYLKYQVEYVDPFFNISNTAKFQKNGLELETVEGATTELAQYTDKGSRFSNSGSFLRHTLIDVSNPVDWVVNLGHAIYNSPSSIPKTRNIFGYQLVKKTANLSTPVGGSNYDGPQFLAKNALYNENPLIGEPLPDAPDVRFSSIDTQTDLDLVIVTKNLTMATWGNTGSLTLLVWHD